MNAPSVKSAPQAHPTPKPKGRPLIEIRALTKSYGAGAGARRVLDNIHLDLEEGEFLAIVGGSGAGKSTLLSLLAGLQRPTSGELLLRGKPITAPGPERALVFQQHSLLPWLTAAGNVRLAVDQAFAADSRAAREERVQRHLELVRLGDAGHKLPHELSGGMRQRVAVARALAVDPEVLLMDEPFGALDALTRGTLQKELQLLAGRGGRTVVFVTNDVQEALLLADRVAVLLPGGRLEDPVAVDLARPRDRESLLADPRGRFLLQAFYERLAQRSAGGDGPSRGRTLTAGGGSAAAETVASAGQGSAVAAQAGSGTGQSQGTSSAATKAAPALAHPHLPSIAPKTPTNAPLLKLRGIEQAFGTGSKRAVIVRDIDLDVRLGEFVCLLGHSGCGKTTLLNLVAGLAQPTAGSLELDGQGIQRPGPERALVFQAHALLPWLSAFENVRLGLDGGRAAGSSNERDARARYYLERVGLAQQMEQRPSDLSAGMRQRVGVARAFALDPRLLLLDEPFGSLDSATREELQHLVLELWGDGQRAALMVTHDVEEALLLADRIVLMTDGPAAGIGLELEVPLERPRRLANLRADSRFLALRRQIIDFLATGAARPG